MVVVGMVELEDVEADVDDVELLNDVLELPIVDDATADGGIVVDDEVTVEPEQAAPSTDPARPT